MVSEWFASGRVVEVILLLVALEACALLAWRGLRRREPGLLALLPSLAAGACLLLALRAALLSAPWSSVAAWLSAALLAHVVDLAGRLRS